MTGPDSIYSAAQVRALDAYEISQRGVPGFVLMTRAAEAALALLREGWPRTRRLTLVCGAGNNGGDAYVLARLARQAGLEPVVLAAADPAQLTGDAARAHAEWLGAGGSVQAFSAQTLVDAELIVDGLLGTGLRGAPRPAAAAQIEAINAVSEARGTPVIALDIPSGLEADNGTVARMAVRATATLTFVALKSGLFLGEGPAHTGEVRLADLGIVNPATPEFEPIMQRLDESELPLALPRRARDSHKGSNGRVLVVGGGVGMPGALGLAGEAALRVGAGLVTVAGAPENLVPVTATRPELIYLPVATTTSLDAAVRAANVVAIGPGLGTGEWAQRLWAQVLRAEGPLVVLDADALNLLALTPVKLPANWIITPHPGEAARLLGTTTEDVQADRPEAARALRTRFGAVAVLKGAGTLIATDAGVALCERGNPGMATAGMGDVLTGVIAGILAQCRDSARAARVGVLAHALAGDEAARGGERGLVASDVIAMLRSQVNP
jgi:hydroxyethylthiazole kinase-like uncharacterized protein yjeF